MSRTLIAITAVSGGLALVISMSANASSVEASVELKPDFRAIEKRLQLLNLKGEITESEMSNHNRFPLMLPQPSKSDGQNKYDLG